MKKHTLSILLAACLAATAHAADKPKEAAFGKGTGAMLTKEQLRSCLNQKAHLNELDAELVKEQGALAATKADVLREGDEIKAKLESLDRTQPDAVAEFNAQTEAHDKRIDAYQERVTAFNARVDAGKAERETYGKGCDNRRYLEDDEIAIRKGK